MDEAGTSRIWDYGKIACIVGAFALIFGACSGSHRTEYARSLMTQHGVLERLGSHIVILDTSGEVLMRGNVAGAWIIAAWIDTLLPTGLPRVRDYAHDGYNVRSMLEDAAQGGGFQCDDRVAFFMDCTRALGFPTRRVKLRAANGERHSMADVYFPSDSTWVLFDTFYMATFLDDAGHPLSAIKVMRAKQGHKPIMIVCFHDNSIVDEMMSFLHTMEVVNRPRPKPEETVRRCMLYDHMSEYGMIYYTNDDALLISNSHGWFEWPL